MQTIFNERMDTKKLRQKILDLAIHGKLVPQNPNDEPASVLLERIRAEKERLIAEGKIKRSKKSATSDTSHCENEVPFDVPEGWSWCTLDELTTSIGDGLHGTPKFDDNGEYYFVNGNNLDGIISIKTETKRTTIDEYTKQGLKFNSQTIFVSINGTLGNIAFYNNEPIVLGKSACYINLLDGISKEYIATILRCQYFLNYCRDSATGSTIKNVPLAAMRSLFIPIPSYQEQLRIVAEVEKLLSFVDTLDENTNKLGNAITIAKSKILDLAIHGKLVPQDPNDEPASELLKRINPKAVASCDNAHDTNQLPDSWCWSTLGDVCSFISGYSYSSSEYKKAGIPLVRISDINDGIISLDNCAYIQPQGKRNVYLQKGDILIAMSGATTGKMGIYMNEESAILNQRIGVVRVTNSKIISEKYRDYFLYRKSSDILKLAYGGAQPNISGKMICSLLLPLPPYSEQLRIVAKIEELFSHLDMIEKSLQA